MKNAPVQARAIKKIEKLIAAASTCFSEDGFETTTSKSIANRAGVATGTFYQYFDNKEDILREIARRKYDAQEQALHQPPAGEHWTNLTSLFEEALHQAYAFNADEPELHQIIEQRRGSDPALAAIVDAGEARILALMHRLVTSFGVENAEPIAFTLFSMAEGVIHRHALIGGGDVTKNDALRIAAEVLAGYFDTLKKTC